MFNIQLYIDSLPDDTTVIDISNKELTVIPDLSRFTKLKQLDCSHNQLTSLPALNDKLETLQCSYNNLTSLPVLNKNLEKLYCYYNHLTSLPAFNETLKELQCSYNNLTFLPVLNEKLKMLYCHNNRLTFLPVFNETLEILQCCSNQLTSLPTFNENLKELYCSGNRLTCLPVLNETLEELHCNDNPFDILNCNDRIDIMRRNIKTLHNFRHLYYCLIFKTQFRKWLWELVREPNIALKYHPSYLAEHLIDGAELEDVLDKWIGDE